MVIKSKRKRGNIKKDIASINLHVTPLKDNPRVQELIRKKVELGFESAEEYPDAFNYIGRSGENMPKNPKNRTPLREREFDLHGVLEDEAKDWKMRRYLKDGEIPPIKLRKKSTKSKPKPKRKKKDCGCDA